MRPALIPLVKARALIADPAKWGKGPRCDRSGHETYCAAEAVEAYTYIDIDLRKEAFAKLRSAAGISKQWGSLPDWNDAPERTHTEVLAAFDKAIEAAS